MCRCYLCGSKLFIEHTEIEVYTYQGKEYDLQVDYSTCKECGQEVITTEQILINEERVRNIKSNISK